MKIEEMLKSREAAGARYAKAVEELKGAYVALAALNIALLNRHHGAPDEVQTFDGAGEQGLPSGFIHPHFAPRAAVTGAWHKDVAAKAAEHLAALQDAAA